MESVLKRSSIFKISENTRQGIIIIICLLCVLLFAYTAYSKIIDFPVFKRGIHKLAFIGAFADLAAWSIPSIELMICVVLIIPKTRRIGLLAFLTLMTLFTIYILGLMIFGFRLPCYCGAAIEELTWPQHIWFNISFIGIALFALWLGKVKNKSNLPDSIHIRS